MSYPNLGRSFVLIGVLTGVQCFRTLRYCTASASPSCVVAEPASLANQPNRHIHLMSAI